MLKIEEHRNSPNFTPGVDVPRVFGYYRDIDVIIFHHWGDPRTNPTFDGVVNWLCSRASGVSAHCVMEDGRASFIVNPWDAAWGSGNAWGNARAYQVELNPRCSKGDMRTVVEWTADFWYENGYKPCKGHDDFFNTKCPGLYDPSEIERQAKIVYRNKYKKRI